MSVRIEPQVEPIPGYRLLERLGAGGFGEVWKCEAPGGIFKAIKIIHGDLRSKDSDLVRYAEQELKALKRVKQVRHPYLLALDRYDIVDGRLMIVMELADCNLWDRFRECRDKGLTGIPRDELLQYMAEAAEVLDLMNDQFQLQHLDIKPQNLFLLHNHVKVADFGQVKDLQGLMADGHRRHHAGVRGPGDVRRRRHPVLRPVQPRVRLPGAAHRGPAVRRRQHEPVAHAAPESPAEPGPDPGRRPAGAGPALSKKPDDRWPSVAAFVRALAGSAGGSATHTRLVVSSPDVETPHRAATTAARPACRRRRCRRWSSPATPPPRSNDYLGPVFTPAPPELTGAGPLRPALVIGLGQPGLRVVQRLRFDLGERFGPASMTPAVRTLYIDTDPEALDDAARDRSPGPARRAVPGRGVRGPAEPRRALPEAAVQRPHAHRRVVRPATAVPAAAHPGQTLGVRLFGRLAFLDHYRALMAKVQAELEAALAPDAMLLTEARTGLQRRTNRPRVYVVGGLAGGTGGGMFLDLAYAVRSRLKRMGYDAPEVIGLFVLPPADATLTPPQPLGNTYAALTELNHYSRPDTVFTAHYDERNGFVREKDAPFTRCYLLPGPAAGLTVPQPGSGVSPAPRRTPPNIPAPAARVRDSGPVAKPGSRVIPMNAQRTPDPTSASAALKPFADAADRIRLDLFAPVGRAADDVRDARTANELEEKTPTRGPVVVATFGLATFDWPRTEVVARTAVSVAAHRAEAVGRPGPEAVPRGDARPGRIPVGAARVRPGRGARPPGAGRRPGRRREGGRAGRAGGRAAGAPRVARPAPGADPGRRWRWTP